MARIKTGALKQHEKILIQMLSCKTVAVKEIADTEQEIRNTYEAPPGFLVG